MGVKPGDAAFQFHSNNNQRALDPLASHLHERLSISVTSCLLALKAQGGSGIQWYSDSPTPYADWRHLS
jgi:hypothetical protein